MPNSPRRPEGGVAEMSTAAPVLTLSPTSAPEPGWLASLRAEGRAAFAAKGWPTPKTEAWKYTNLAPLAKLAFKPSEPVANGVRATALPWLLPESDKAHRLVFVNGLLRPDLSAIGRLPAGVELDGLAATLAVHPERVESRLGKLGTVAEQPLLALNTASLQDGFVLRIGRGVALETPVELLFISLPGAEPLSYHPRGLVLAEAGSRALLVEHHVRLGEGTAVGKGASFANLALEIDLEEGAALEHYKLQAEGPEAFHIATNLVRVGRAARYESFVLAQGGALGRNEVALTLAGEGASCRLDIAYMGRDRQLIDNTGFVDHAVPNTKSRQTCKGVLDDRARGVFQGRVLVRPGAQKTDAHQINRALLLAPGAEIDSKPQLEIHADDVKCGHGAAAGDLDAEAMFYLRSRAIPEAEARRILTAAFLSDAIDAIGHEALRESFRAAVLRWTERAGT
jgi:Fe-S cluster assembly protein SufD